jgi:hypothetical protein
MNDFRKYIFEPLQSKAKITFRTQSAYNDILRIQEISEYIESRSSEDNYQIGQLITLLKAMYMFADIFLKVFLSEVSGSNVKSFITWLISQKKIIYLQSDILPIYNVVVYRNKVIVHHDLIRYPANYRNLTFINEYRIYPQPQPGEMIYWNEINRLWENHKNYFTEKAIDPFERVEILFNNIPVELETTKSGKIEIGKDRKSIDKIVEVGGCRSKTRQEIVQAVDQFALAIVKTV